MTSSPAETITDEIIRQAMTGAELATNPALLTTYEGRPPYDYSAAIRAVATSPEKFREVLWARLQKLPHFKEVFGGLVRIRIQQDGCLEVVS